MNKLNILLGLLLLLVCCYCTTNENQAEFAADIMMDELEPAPTNQSVDVIIGRKVIKEGEIRFETSSVENTKQSISQAIQDYNGYISNDDVYNSKSEIEHRLVIRIPSDDFDEFLNKITQDVSKLDAKTINVIDVTEEFIDIST